MSSKKTKNKPPDQQALKRNKLPKNIQWMHDFDYIDRLAPKDKEWMNKFISEYYHARVTKGDRTALHKNRRLRQDCYTRKNAQNRDLQSIMDSRGKMDRVAETEETGDSSRSRGLNYSKKR